MSPNPPNLPPDEGLQSQPSASGARPSPPQKGRTGQKDKRSRRRPSGDVNVELTDRDISILRVVDKFRLVNAQQLATALSPATRYTTFAHRLQQLFHAGVLDRPPAQFQGGQAPKAYVYAVGPAGRTALDRLDGIARHGKRDRRSENDRLALRTLTHRTAVVETCLAFQLATEREKGWSFEVAIEDEIPAVTGLPPRIDIAFRSDVNEPLPLRADAHVLIDAGGGITRAYLLEIDLGTEPQIRWNLRTSSIVRKAIAYWQLSFWKAAPVSGVIFLAPSRDRVEGMIETVRQADPKGKGSHFFHFALLDDCAIGNHEALFYDPLFRSAKTGYDNPRKLFLDTCPVCNQFIDAENEAHEPITTEDGPACMHTDCPGLRSGLRM